MSRGSFRLLNMRLGIGTYTFAWAIGVPDSKPPQPLTEFALLEEARRLGVGLVQFCDNLPLTRLSPVELDRFESEVKAQRLLIEIGTRGLAMANLRSNLALCRKLHSPILRLVIDSAGDEPSPEEAVARLRPLRMEFLDAGVRLAIENHDRFSSATLARMVQALGIEYAGICLDTVNSFGALEGPEVVVEHLGEFTACLHVKDFTIRRPRHNMGFIVEGCAAGHGRLDIPWLLRKLAPVSSPINAILETWVTPGDALEETMARERAWAERGVQYLRRFIMN